MLGAEFRTREVSDEEDEMVGSLAYAFSGGSRPIVGIGCYRGGCCRKERNLLEEKGINRDNHRVD